MLRSFRIQRVTPDIHDKNRGIVLLKRYALGTYLHPQLRMPVLRSLPHDDGDLITLPSTVSVPLSKQGCHLLHSLTLQDQSVDFFISVQHDCIMAGCPIDARKAEMQEREMTSRKSPAVRHLDDDHFILNTHSMHNYNRLRQLLLSSLITPKLLYPDRQAKHREWGEKATLAYKKKQSRRKRGSKTAWPAAEEDSKGLESGKIINYGEDLDVGQVRYDEGWPSWRLRSFSGYNSSARIYGDHLTTSVLAIIMCGTRIACVNITARA